MKSSPVFDQRPAMGQTIVKLPFGGRASTNPAHVRGVFSVRVLLLGFSLGLFFALLLLQS
jgi:hypothetical protein